MSTPHKFIQSRVDFGNAILACFKKNDWPQSITEAVAKELKIEGGPWASQVSTAINGKLDPKPAFFIAFGLFNAYIHKGDFSKIKDKSLKEKLKDRKAFTHNNGRPFDGADFFRLFTGMIEVPKKYRSSGKQIDSNQIARLGKLLAQHFLTIKRTEMLTPKETWDLFSSQTYAKTLAPEDLLTINDVLRDDIAFTADIVEHFKARYGKCPILTTFRAMSKAKFSKELVALVNDLNEADTIVKKKQTKRTPLPK